MKRLRVLVACEFSGIVREAFKAKGHDAWSCDLLPTEIPGQHIQGDVLEILNDGWDLMIAHPPCTHLAVSGARWFKEKQSDGRQQSGIDFFMKLIAAQIPKVAVENPVGIMSKKFRKPDQIIQPYFFGDSCQKATCLWIKNLPLLSPTNIVDRGLIYVDPRGNKHGGVHTMRAKRAYSSLMLLAKNEERWKIRSRTFQGIADAMAEQWGVL
jgi:site-specific DNA-cytosine methylase